MEKFLAVVGPTATGKTAMGIAIAKRLDGEIVSADSRQVYRGMDIGTGKDLPADRTVDRSLQARSGKRDYTLPCYRIDDVPVWLYDAIEPDGEFSVAVYRDLARAVITDIWNRGKLPIVVGGTGLYVSSLTGVSNTYGIPPDAALRLELSGKSANQLADILRQKDPMAWEAMNVSDRNNPRRLVRRIERAGAKPALPPDVVAQDVLMVGLTADRDTLYRRVDDRVETRLRAGAVAEIEGLVASGYGFGLPSMSALGYGEWADVVTLPSGPAKDAETARAVSRWKFGEHAYVRRQLTWFKRIPEIHWFDITAVGYVDAVLAAVDAWYTGTTV